LGQAEGALVLPASGALPGGPVRRGL